MFEQQIQPVCRLANSIKIDNILVSLEYADSLQVLQKLTLIQWLHVVGHNMHLTRLIICFANNHIAKLATEQHFVNIEHKIMTTNSFVRFNAIQNFVQHLVKVFPNEFVGLVSSIVLLGNKIIFDQNRIWNMVIKHLPLQSLVLVMLTHDGRTVGVAVLDPILGGDTHNQQH